MNKKWTRASVKPASPKRPSHFGGIKLDSISMILSREAGQFELYLGDQYDAKDQELLAQLGIRAVLTVASGLGVYYSKNAVTQHQVLQVQDQEHFNILPYFDRAFEFIERARTQSAVLVHCQAGVSRSNTIVCSYLMRKLGWSSDKALTFVKARRRNTHPNQGFIKALKNFEKKIGHSNSYVQLSQSAISHKSDSHQKYNYHTKKTAYREPCYSSRYYVGDKYSLYGRKQESWQRVSRVSSASKGSERSLKAVRSFDNFRKYKKGYGNY